MAARIPAGLSAREGKRFGLTVGLAFLALTAISMWRGHEFVAWATGTLGGSLILGAVLLPGRLGPVYSAWMGLAAVLSEVTTPLFMGLVFYLVFTPTGVLMRLLGKRSLVRRPADGSFWIDREPSRRKRVDMERQF